MHPVGTRRARSRSREGHVAAGEGEQDGPAEDQGSERPRRGEAHVVRFVAAGGGGVPASDGGLLP